MVPMWTRTVVPPAGPLRRYAFVSLVDATGTGMFLTVSVLYFTRIVGLSAGSVAAGLSLAGLAAMVAAVPLGSVGDRFGHRRIWVLLTVIQAAVFAMYPFVQAFPQFLVLAAIASVAEVGGSPLRAAFLSRTAGPEQRVRARAYNQAVTNAGFAVGSLAAGAALSVGTREAVVVLAVGCVVLTLAEMLQSAGGWGLSYALAPEDRQGEYLGAFAMGTRIYDSLGPVLVTSMILGLGRLGWILLGVLYVVLALGRSAAAGWARRTRPVMTAATATS
jgi:Major Facilitator Superfamily